MDISISLIFLFVCDNSVLFRIIVENLPFYHNDNYVVFLPKDPRSLKGKGPDPSPV